MYAVTLSAQPAEWLLRVAKVWEVTPEVMVERLIRREYVRTITPVGPIDLAPLDLDKRIANAAALCEQYPAPSSHLSAQNNKRKK